jgi:ABC-type sugar transport system permease subunit
MVATSNGYPPAARLVPMLAAYQVWRERAAIPLVGVGRTTERRKDPIDASTIAWFVIFALIVLVGGFTVGGPIAVIVSQRMWLKESWRTALIGGAAAFVLLYVCVDRLMGLVLFSGWIALLVR